MDWLDIKAEKYELLVPPSAISTVDHDEVDVHPEEQVA
jgi:hypothetical protein